MANSGRSNSLRRTARFLYSQIYHIICIHMFGSCENLAMLDIMVQYGLINDAHINKLISVDLYQEQMKMT